MKYWLLVLTFGLVASEYARETWDRFTFTQEWPQTACFMGREEKKTCGIPTYVTSFGIHGLWPTSKSSQGPTNCTGDPFNMAKIKNLTKELEFAWPNVYSNTPNDSFWKHEWETHGTCAVSLPATGTEYMFFQKTLQLMAKYNASRYLNAAKIVPGKNSYKLGNLESAVYKSLNVKTIFTCYRNPNVRNRKQYYLAEVRICLDKKFNLINCEVNQTLYYRPRYYTPHLDICRDSFEIIFPPIKRD